MSPVTWCRYIMRLFQNSWDISMHCQLLRVVQYVGTDYCHAYSFGVSVCNTLFTVPCWRGAHLTYVVLNRSVHNLNILSKCNIRIIVATFVIYVRQWLNQSMKFIQHCTRWCQTHRSQYRPCAPNGCLLDVVLLLLLLLLSQNLHSHVHQPCCTLVLKLYELPWRFSCAE